MYCLACNKLVISWETKVGHIMGLKCNKHTNLHFDTLTYFVQKVKEDLDIIRTKVLNYQLKVGLVVTVADYV